MATDMIYNGTLPAAAFKHALELTKNQDYGYMPLLFNCGETGQIDFYAIEGSIGLHICAQYSDPSAWTCPFAFTIVDKFTLPKTDGTLLFGPVNSYNYMTIADRSGTEFNVRTGSDITYKLDMYTQIFAPRPALKGETLLALHPATMINAFTISKYWKKDLAYLRDRYNADPYAGMYATMSMHEGGLCRLRWQPWKNFYSLDYLSLEIVFMQAQKVD